MAHLTYEQRKIIEKSLKEGVRKYKLAEQLGFSAGAIYREIARGSVDGVYNAKYAQNRYRKNLSHKGPAPLFSENSELASYVSSLIRKGHSPDYISRVLTVEYPELNIVPKTIYNAVEHGMIPFIDKNYFKKNPYEASVSSGSIRIPAWVTKKYNLSNGDRLKFKIEGKKLILELKDGK